MVAKMNIHPILECSFSQEVWKEIQGSLGPSYVWIGECIEDALKKWVNTQRPKNHKFLPLIIAWEFGFLRNMLFFRISLLLLSAYPSKVCISIMEAFP
jgi:hypothetical protein